MENFLLPSKVEFAPLKEANTASVIITPCYHGYGTTLGNALRRVLLSSLPGAAVESFKIKGVNHEFSTVEGVKEDVVEIMLNLKELVVKVHSDDPVVLTLTKKGPGPVTAGDITPNSTVDVINTDLVIANLTSNKTLDMEITVSHGRGYKPAEEKDRQSQDLGTIVIDSVYTPVRDVGYVVDFTRVGDITNYEKLTLNIETNGTITPEEAMQQATKILMDHFTIISGAVANGGTGKEEALAVEEVAPVEAVEETEVVEEEVEAPKKAKRAKKKAE